VEGQGEAKKPKLDDKATLNRLRKLKKRLRSLEESNASEELKLALQQQIAALIPYAPLFVVCVCGVNAVCAVVRACARVWCVRWCVCLNSWRRSAEESAEAAVHRRLAQIEKLDTMLRDVRPTGSPFPPRLCCSRDTTRHTCTTHRACNSRRRSTIRLRASKSSFNACRPSTTRKGRQGPAGIR